MVCHVLGDVYRTENIGTTTWLQTRQWSTWGTWFQQSPGLENKKSANKKGCKNPLVMGIDRIFYPHRLLISPIASLACWKFINSLSRNHPGRILVNTDVRALALPLCVLCFCPICQIKASVLQCTDQHRALGLSLQTLLWCRWQPALRCTALKRLTRYWPFLGHHLSQQLQGE